MKGSKNFATRNIETSFHFHLKQRLREGMLILSSAFALFVMLALTTYHASDPGWSQIVSSSHIANAGGKAGAWIADVLFYFCGFVAFLFPVLIAVGVWLVYASRHLEEEQSSKTSMLVFRSIGFVLVFITACGLIDLQGVVTETAHHPFQPGGILGTLISQAVLMLFNATGSTIILLTFLLIGITLFTGLSWFYLLEAAGRLVLKGIDFLKGYLRIPRFQWSWGNMWSWLKKRESKVLVDEDTPKFPVIHKIEPHLDHVEHERIPERVKLKIEPHAMTSQESPAGVPVVKQIPRENHAQTTVPSLPKSYSNVIPPLTLLKAAEKNNATGFSDAELQLRSGEVEQRLADFGIEAKVVAVHPGPVVTRFELQLAAGTKAGKVTALARDLARSMSVVSVRIVEVIPGKPVIGLELPNPEREIVSLQEVLASKAYQNSRAPLSLALGKDIAGHPVVVDLAKMPHLLVAGTTGSGKSVNLNAMLLSLIYKSTPEQLRFILIDPKMLELSIYEGIPHLLAPVVTDMKDAASALRWCVIEMERRYRLMAALGVRNIAGYNVKVSEAQKRGEPIMDPLSPPELTKKPLEELPHIVVLADEFADMMAVVGKKVEVLIARLAQKARAAGIHLILATQRPSVDVITGLIKANIPTRIAFQVSSKIDSRTILDQQGAEQLLGNGDMLYLPPGTGVPVRVHGAFVHDDEVHRVTAYLRELGAPQYIEEILQEDAAGDLNMPEGSVDGGGDGEQDPLYDEAVEFIVKAQRVSVSSVQRRFRIGYNRASRLVEAMEQARIVSKMDQNGSREILVPVANKEE